MKFAVDSSHRDYYRKEKSIEFEQLVSDAQLLELKNTLKSWLGKKNLEQAFKEGRDLWRQLEPFKKLMRSPALAEIAAQLNDLRQVRVGFDQYLPGSIPLKEGTSLQEGSSIQGVAGGVIICLQPSPEKETFFPKTAGNGVFIAPEKQFYKVPADGEYILLVYTGPKPMFVEHPDDIHGFTFKNLGYGYGDKLRIDTHPYILK